MEHEHDAERDGSGDLARRDGGGDRGQDSGHRDAEGVGDSVAEVEGAADGDPGETSQIYQVAQRFEGPLPPVAVLQGYEDLVPGSARKLIDAHVRNEQVRGETVTRLSRAEAFAVITGAVGAQVLTIGGLLAAVALLVAGYPAASVAAIIPAILGASAQVVAAYKRREE